ncbi:MULTISPECIES: ExeM/NucH family extracellular endonuclease [unclassified Duganella]|uniref:ExeM/NucH family extracellular endonuclease n=1 Tax=unclassified Duganella TaxID=2636909 RepID=UPI0006FDBD2D|nr:MULTISPECIES: ExeM/NucH family extracellular endonuclease [unclassified Duganella]KQV45595.1 endonuclease/exonuclease/phosphatase [Duganella sp. Root336D2]KRC00774.1 endonuclease/exonuclease/phosphatase [Duganella sp. Root198D2]
MDKRIPLRASALAALLACQPAFAADVVISQMYGAGGNNGATLRYDYVELFNRGSAAVAVGGWTIQYASASGTTWGKAELPAGTSIDPGKYFLLKLASSNVAVGADFAADHYSASVNMSGASGKVALVNNNTALSGAQPGSASIQDVVGYGSANFSETAAATGMSATTSLLRANNGCTDSNNNAADFSAVAPQFRTAASPANMCDNGPLPQPIVPLCPAAAKLNFGAGGSIALSASDADGIVNDALLTSAAVPGLSLGKLLPAGGVGGSASVSLLASPSLAAGTYPVAVKFSNDQGQEASCTVSLTVEVGAGTVVPVPQIQGSGASSPFSGAKLTTEGVVTATVGSGFFIQDVAGDGDPNTSDGMFVYMGAAAMAAKVGDLVRVSGTVTEYKPSGATRSYTELSSVTSVLTQSTGNSITPANIDLSSTSLANVEGMLVRFPGALTVNATDSLASRGELTLSAGRREIPTNRYPARSADALALAAQNAANMITLDDGLFVTPATVPYLDQDGTVRVGYTVSGLTGVIDFGALGSGGAGFKLQPTEAPVFSRDNPRTPVPEVAAGNLKVASANVLNFFTTFMDGTDVLGQTGQGCTLGSGNSKANCRGADNMAEFVRQRDKIVAGLKAIDADVVGLMEIQNNGDYATSYLVDSLNSAYGRVEYAYVPKPPATGTDAIRVAMIYKPAKVALAGAALSDAAQVNDRPPMAQTFKANNGAKFSVIVNHLKSKRCNGASGANADQNDGQSCYNADRMAQAQQLAESFVPQVVAAAGDPDVLLIGDFNAYGMEDPIMYLTAAERPLRFENQVERFVRPNGMPHSYVFGGESGYLDHALASAAMSSQVAGAMEWNANADEPEVLDFNLDGKNAAAQALYNTLPYRASDHDPVVISLNLAPSYVDVTSSVQIQRSGLVQGRFSSIATATAWLTNSSGADMAAPLQYVLQGLPAGVTLANASGSINGMPYITAAPALAAGAQATVQLQFNNPGRVAVNYTPKVYNGSF